MALIITAEDRGTVRPGDVMFSYHPATRDPLHVGIYVGRQDQLIDPDGAAVSFDVCSVPRQCAQPGLGTAPWLDGTGTGHWFVTFVGQRLDVDPELVATVALHAKNEETEHSLYGTGEDWGFSRQHYRFLPIAGRTASTGHQLFQSGTCAQFVELMYERANLDLVDQAYTTDPDGITIIRPATQLHAFWRGTYPLRVEWDPRLGEWNDPEYRAVHDRCNDQ